MLNKDEQDPMFRSDSFFFEKFDRWRTLTQIIDRLEVIVRSGRTAVEHLLRGDGRRERQLGNLANLGIF